VLDGVDRNPVVQDCLQEGVFAQLTRELYRYGPTSDDLAHLSGVGMATPPGEDVTDDDQVRARRASRAFAARHCDKRIGGTGIEALALATGLKDRTPCALSSQLDAVDEGHSRFGRKSTAKADHAEPVAPMAEVPDAHLLAVEVAYVGICLAVLAGFVAQLSEVRAPCHLEQFCFSTWGLGLCLYDLGCLQNR
jgi:hypothetical protein